jgi:hypothetical protein
VARAEGLARMNHEDAVHQASVLFAEGLPSLPRRHG